MKAQLLLLPLAGLLSSCARQQSAAPTQVAQVAPSAGTAPSSVATAPPSTTSAPVDASIEPKAAALLKRATATYKGASGLSFAIASRTDREPATTLRFKFARPNSLLIEVGNGPKAGRLLRASDALYIVDGDSYQKKDLPPVGATTMLANGSGASGALIAPMLDGQDPILASQASFSKPPFQNYKSRTLALPDRAFDGTTLSGVQTSFTCDLRDKTGQMRHIRNQTVAWFGGTPFALRRVQTTYAQASKTLTIREEVQNQQISPAFSANTFRFDATGLQLDDPNIAYDQRLQPGVAPFPFEAKSLDGTAISPARYKGKVLLMDFWATWCGPCVASLPELQATYDKYHAQGFEVVGISHDDDKQALVNFIKARSIRWPEIYDPAGQAGRLPRLYKVRAIPFTVLVGKDGRISAVNPLDLDSAVQTALAAK